MSVSRLIVVVMYLGLFCCSQVFANNLSAPANYDEALASISQKELVETTNQPMTAQSKIESQQVAEKTNAQYTNEQSLADKKALLYKLTHSDYSSSYERKKPVHKDSWLKRLLDYLFNRDYEDKTEKQEKPTSMVFPSLTKLLLVFGLFVELFVIYRYKTQIMYWVSQLKMPNKQSNVEVADYFDAHLHQSWEKLPKHTDIGRLVLQLLEQNKQLPASSVLYRASLRWLNQQKKLAISVATTEMECVKLIEQLQNTSLENQPNGLDINTKNYIQQIIEIWMQLAYKNSDLDCKTSLTNLTNQWMQLLPIETDGIENNVNPKRIGESV